jgi:hypothetical protein
VSNFLYRLLDWSEVWAILIPLIVLQVKRGQSPSLKPVIVYVWIAFMLNLAIDVIMTVNIYFENDFLSNNPLYNIHSVIRFICFFTYFIIIQPASFSKVKKTVATLAVLFLVFNFLFAEKFFNYESFSGNLLATEAYLLLVFCMMYYLAELKDNDENLFNSPHFWVVTGLSIYVAINFFVFLFYLPMIYVDRNLAVNIWYVHNIAFIIFCLFLTKAFYGPFRNQYSV